MRKRRIAKKWCWSYYISAYKRMHIDPHLPPCTEPKWIKDLNRKTDAINLREGKMEKILEHFDSGNNLINKTPIAEALRPTITKWDFRKLKNFSKQRTVLIGKMVAYKIGKDFYQHRVQ